MWTKRSAVVLCALALAACSEDPYGGITFEGEFGEAVPFEQRSGLIFVQASVDGVEGTYVVDTGSQWVLLDLDLASELGYPTGAASEVGELELGGIRFAGVRAVPYDLAPIEATLGVELDGFIGASLLRYFTTVVDTQGLTLTLLDGEDEAAAGLVDVERVEPAAMSAGFAVHEDLGLALAEARFDGAAAQVAIDTGASATALFRSFYETLDPGDRPVLSGVAGLSASGGFTLDVTRFCGVELGDALASDVHVGVIDDEALGEVRSLLPDLAGLLGHTFLREFLTVLDYPGRAARFYRYRDRSHIPADEYVQAGLTLARDGAGDVVVEHVFPGTDAAAQGLAQGDRVVNIDGAPAAGLTDDALAGALHGEPGETVTLEVDRDGTSLSFTIAIEDLLPDCQAGG
jgi:predicted aspartyl protease